jgi:putative protease
MKIVAPVSSIQDAEMLLHFGADELYCGVTTPEWEEHFGGKWWMNRRAPSGANLPSWEDVTTVAEMAHAQNAPIYLTLNAPFYPEESVRYLLKLTEKLVGELQIDGIIVSDIGFLMALKREELPLRIHLSSLGGCFNSRSAGFFKSLGVDRIILPRQLRLSEIDRLLRETVSGVEFEVFALNDGCFFEESFCQTTHAFGPFCLTDWQVGVRKTSGSQSSGDEIEGHLKELKEYLWYQNNCGSSFQEDGLPNGPCSLCRFGHFRDWGVAAVKIVGREASFHRKMGSIQLVKALMDEVRTGGARDEIASAARALRKTPEYCDKGYMCYYRD